MPFSCEDEDANHINVHAELLNVGCRPFELDFINQTHSSGFAVVVEHDSGGGGGGHNDWIMVISEAKYQPLTPVNNYVITLTDDDEEDDEDDDEDTEAPAAAWATQDRLRNRSFNPSCDDKGYWRDEEVMVPAKNRRPVLLSMRSLWRSYIHV